MTHDHPKKVLTAAELARQLAADPEYQRMRKEKDARHAARVDRFKIASAPILEALHAAGFAVNSLDDLRRSSQPYPAAIPILLKWVPLDIGQDVKEWIVRTLSVPWAKPVAVEPLIDAFRKAPDESSLKWAIGNALEVLADDSVFNTIAELIRDRSHGTARQMLVVALAKMKDPRAAVLAAEMLDRPDRDHPRSAGDWEAPGSFRATPGGGTP